MAPALAALLTRLSAAFSATLRRLSPGPTVFAAVTVAALLYSWRGRRMAHVERVEARAVTSGGRALAGVRRVTIGMEGAGDSAVFEDGRVRGDVVPGLVKFARLFEVYVVARVDCDEEEERVLGALRDVGLFAEGLMDERKVVFCGTSVGRVSVVRQLEPHLHVDETAQVVTGLQRFVKYVALVAPDAKSMSAPTASNVLKFPSLSSFF